MNCLSWEVTLPKRVGVPKTTASAQIMSSGWASGMSAVACTLAAQAGVESMAACGASSWALRSRTSAPAASELRVISLAMVATVPVLE